MMKPQPARVGARQARGVLAPASIVLSASLLVPAAGAGGAEPGPIELGGLDAAQVGESYAVTLLTGDVVHWNVAADGTGSVTIDDDDNDSVFEFTSTGDDYYVIPMEVAPLVGDSLDRELFNIAGLVEMGYTDDAVDGTPVIVTSDSGKAMRRASTVPGLTVERSLSSINGVSGTIKHSETEALGDALVASVESTNDKAVATFEAPALAGVDKVWLDRKLEVNLEDSVPQTGAPQAWAAGFDGTGSTIAVLDTGIDVNHPDVAGQIVLTKDFTVADGTDTVADGHGHGTHVAATAAGTGEASDGLRKGVAPGADLVIGKVMGDDGGGATSDIMAGMEWAASNPDVDVINMSLGGSASDGTDPMSVAVNNLTDEYGVLFVIAAGNDGPGRGTVSYPSTADAALSVGAVDSEHNLAYFSGRGPRVGDYGIKPEITAPGVGIRAARANGTSMGSPLDEFYTAADGTSMATPHVAGAAAIVAQQHPDWDPATVKGALINSATPKDGLTVWEQGGGELNLAETIHTTVVSSPSTLNMGHFEFPHEPGDPEVQTLTYTNLGEQATTLGFSAALTDEDGNAAPEGMITFEPSTLELAAGASGEVSVTVDTSLGGNQSFGGSIEATADDGQRMAGTPVGFVKEPELFTLTVDGITRDGGAASGFFSTVAVTDAENLGDFGRSTVKYVDGVATVDVPAGTYNVMSMIATTGTGGAYDIQSQTLQGDPEIEIIEDTHLSFDAREATEVTVDTPYEDVKIESNSVQYQRVSSETGSWIQGWVGAAAPVFASPTDPVSLGEFNFGSGYELSAPGVWMTLVHPEYGTIPEALSYEVNEQTTATVDTAYHSNVPQELSRASVAAFPWEAMGLGVYRDFDGPVERTEIYSANGARFNQAVNADAPFGPMLTELETRYEPGQHLQESWFASPNTPSLREGNEHTESILPTRTGDEMSLNIFEWGDSNSGDEVHYGYRIPTPGTDTSAFEWFIDGELYAYGERAFGAAPVPAGEHRMRFELDVAREADWWTTSTATKTAWEFDSATTSETQALPLLQIDYDIDLDLNNTAPHPRDVKGPFTIGLDVRMPYGVDDTDVDQVTGWLSYDEGATWTKRPVRSTGDGFEMVADRRGGDGHVSIKVEASDTDGNVIEQEVINAYKTRP